MKVNFETTAPKTIFEALRTVGHDEDFEGRADERLIPTEAVPGSPEKIEVFQQRVEQGLPLYHAQDQRLPVEPRWDIPTVCEPKHTRKRKGSDD